MDTPGTFSDGLEHTPTRGWAVLLLFRAQLSTAILISYSFGVFLPFISEDLRLSPLKAGLLQGAWWLTPALLSLPSATWLSRFRPVPLVLISLLIQVPFLFFQGLAVNFITLFLARLFFVLFHVTTIPARTLLLQQWVASRQYALVNAVGLSQHSVMLAVAISTSALIITGLGSWRVAYFILGAFLSVQTLAWLWVAQERWAPAKGLQRALEEQRGTPLRAVRSYPQGWLIGITMFGMAATWTALVTFLPTLWLEEGGISLTLGGPILAFLYYALIPSSLLGGVVAAKVTNRKLLLAVPAFLNLALGLGITFTLYPPLLMVLITGLGMIWIATPAINVLPFEFRHIQPREVAVVSSLVVTFSGLGFAAGPVITGVVAHFTGSIQTGLVVLCLLTGVGVFAGALYPGHKPGIDAG